MKEELVHLNRAPAGRAVALAEALVSSIGPGRWRLTIQPVRRPTVRSHAAFLNSYAPEDEGLYEVQ